MVPYKLQVHKNLKLTDKFNKQTAYTNLNLTPFSTNPIGLPPPPQM